MKQLRLCLFTEDGTLSVDGLVYVVGEYRRITRVPDDPYVQLKVYHLSTSLFRSSPLH